MRRSKITTEAAAAAEGYNVPVFRAVALIGTTAAAAARCGVYPEKMTGYRNGYYGTPDHVAEALERATHGAVTAVEIKKANKRLQAARLLNKAEKLIAESA